MTDQVPQGPPLILASASPRRVYMLGRLIDPAPLSTRTVHLDEDEWRGADPVTSVLAIARAKAEAGWQRGDRLLAADTGVVHGELLLGKPRDRADARATIGRLRGETVLVATAVVVITPAGARRDEVVTSILHMARPSDDAVAAYVATGAADDKAGGLEVQGRARSFVASIDGCEPNVFGLPLCAAASLLGRERPSGPPPCSLCRDSGVGTHS